MAWNWSSRSCNMYNTFTWTPYPSPVPIDDSNGGPAAESEHLLSWRLPSKWQSHPQTTIPWTLFYQGGNMGNDDVQGHQHPCMVRPLNGKPNI